jgi:predicted lipoprotein with Yx(FWY)xxD motif
VLDGRRDRLHRVTAAIALAGVLLSACGSNAPVGVVSAPPAAVQLRAEVEAGLGAVLAGPRGLTLYRFTRDRPGESRCTGTCLQGWPPLSVATGSPVRLPPGVRGSVGTIAEPGGRSQVEFDGHPLYYYVYDAAPGEDGGQGAGGRWFVLKLRPPAREGSPVS